MKITADVSCRAANYRKSLRWSEEDDAYIGSIEWLCGDCHHGDDPMEVFRTLKRLAEETVAEWDATQLTLPAATADSTSARQALHSASRVTHLTRRLEHVAVFAIFDGPA